MFLESNNFVIKIAIYDGLVTRIPRRNVRSAKLERGALPKVAKIMKVYAIMKGIAKARPFLTDAAPAQLSVSSEDGESLPVRT